MTTPTDPNAKTPTPAASDTGEAEPPRRRRRRILIAAAGLVAALLLLIALLPTLLSTGPGRGAVLSVVNGMIDGKVEADAVRLRWLGGQSIDGVFVTAPGGTRVVENLSINAPDLRLLSAALGSRSFGVIATAADHLRLAANEQGQLDLPGLRGDETDTAPESEGETAGGTTSGGGTSGVDTTVTLTVGRVTFEQPGQVTRTIENFESSVEVRGNRRIDARLRGDVIGGDQPGVIDARFTIDNLTDAAGQVQAKLATIDADVTLTAIPTPVIAALAQYPALNDYLGPTFTTRATAQGTLANFTADADLPPLTLPAGEGQTLGFEGGKLSVRPGDEAGALTATLRGRASTGQVAQDVTLDADLLHLFDDQPMRITTTAQQLPVPLADALAAQEGRLTATLGRMLDLTVTLTEHADGGYELTGEVDAPNLAGPFEGQFIPDKLIAFSTASPLRLRLEPAAYDLWTTNAQTGEPANIRVAEALDAQLRVPGLRLAIVPTPAGEDAGPLGMRIDPAASSLTLSLTSERGVIERREPAATVTIEPFALNIDSKNLNAIELVTQLETIIEQLEGRAAPQGDAGGADAARDGKQAAVPEKGSVTSTTTVRNLFNGRGVLAFKGGTIESVSAIENIPADLLDMLAEQDGQLAATTGPWINGGLTVHHQPGQPGTATAKLDATNLQGTIPIQLAADFSEATLVDDINITLRVTEQTSKSYLGAAHPLFADAVASDPDKPVRVTVKRENVRIPLDGTFDIAALRMDGTIDPGTLMMTRSGWINQALTGIGQQVFGERFGAGREVDTYPAEFSAMTFKIADGKATTSELWLVADKIGMGFQGAIDLRTSQIDRMSIGVLAATFYALGGDARKLPADEVIEVPLKGAVASPRPDIGGLAMSNLDGIAGAVDEDAARWLNVGRAVLEGVGRARGGDGAKYQYQWQPSDAAKAFAEGLKPEAQTTQ